MRLYPVWNIHHSQPYNSLVDALLAVRSLDQAELDVGPEVMHDPANLRDMDRAVERIVRAIRQREKIVVYGDYDVDGSIATSLFVNLFKILIHPFFYYIPDRVIDGYGASKKLFEKTF